MEQARQLTLTARVESTSPALRIAYVVANPTDELAYVSIRTTPCGIASRRPYSILRESSLLVLSFQTAPLPPFCGWV